MTTGSLVVRGGEALSGTIPISGAKNAALPILIAALLAEKSTLENIPDIYDVTRLLDILKAAGSKVDRTASEVRVSRSEKRGPIPIEALKEIRYSPLLIPVLAKQIGFGELPFPGGCELGQRPIHYHFEVLSRFGIVFTMKKNSYAFSADRLVGTSFRFPFPSVGATENALLAASVSTGTSVLENCAIEPEIQDLEHFLTKLGVSIEGIGQRRKLITPPDELKSGVCHRVISDRIEAITYMLLGIICESSIAISQISHEHLRSIYRVFDRLGITYQLGKDSFQFLSAKGNRSMTLKTGVHPGFPTDAQPLFSALFCHLSGGEHTIHESVFPSRVAHVEELQKMGANIANQKNIISVFRASKSRSSRVTARDIRAGASVVLHALGISGSTTVDNPHQIYRGYENMLGKLLSVGAKIEVCA